MSSQRSNLAAWIKTEKSPLTIDKAPYPICGEDELVIFNQAVSINPIDWKIQSLGGFDVKYPTILGEDAVGEVLEVGPTLKHRFAVGQRVMGHALGIAHGPSYGAFQMYSLLKSATACVIPDSMAFAEAVVLPLSISTAAAGLYRTVGLKLAYPKPQPSLPDDDSSMLLLWGGSSSVGSSVIQLASASGYRVITTASPANIDYCKSLGAVEVVDYHEDNVIDRLVSLMEKSSVVGAFDAIGSDTTVLQCASVLGILGGKKVVSVGSCPNEVPHGVEVTRIASKNMDSFETDVTKEVWENFVPVALANGGLVPRPRAKVVGKGLPDVQRGLEQQKEGVSASKIVVAL